MRECINFLKRNTVCVCIDDAEFRWLMQFSEYIRRVKPNECQLEPEKRWACDWSAIDSQCVSLWILLDHLTPEDDRVLLDRGWLFGASVGWVDHRIFRTSCKLCAFLFSAACDCCWFITRAVYIEIIRAYENVVMVIVICRVEGFQYKCSKIKFSFLLLKREITHSRESLPPDCDYPVTRKYHAWHVTVV